MTFEHLNHARAPRSLSVFQHPPLEERSAPTHMKMGSRLRCTMNKNCLFPTLQNSALFEVKYSLMQNDCWHKSSFETSARTMPLQPWYSFSFFIARKLGKMMIMEILLGNAFRGIFRIN